MLKIWTRDNTQITILVLLTAIVIYGLPVLSYPLFAVYFFLAFRSAKPYFWLAFIFILLQAPGDLFSAGTGQDVHRLPIFTVAPGISFATFEIFMFVLIFKALKSKPNHVNLLKNDLQLLAIITLLYFIYSFLYGFTGKNLMLVLRMLFGWSWVFIATNLLYGKEDVTRLFRLLFPVIVLALILQVYSYVVGAPIDSILRQVETVRLARAIDVTSDAASRTISSPYLVFVCFTMSLYYLLLRKNETFPVSYLYTVMISSILIVLLSATRGWILSFSAMLLVFFALQQSAVILKRIAGILAVGLMMFFLLQLQFPAISRQLELSLERLATLEQLAEGDVTAGGTLGRLDQRGPKVLKKFWENPILGLGFSDEWREHADEHVGHHNMLLTYGIIGYLIIMGFFLKWIHMYFFKIPSIFSQNRYGFDGTKFKVFGIGLIGILAIHSTSTHFIGLQFFHLQKYFAYAFLIAAATTLLSDDIKSLSRRNDSDNYRPSTS